MKFQLNIRALGKRPEIEISEANYRDIVVSDSILKHALSIEEKYEILLTNYLALEKALSGTAAEQMVRLPSHYTGFFDAKIAINVALINLLTSARLYVDHIPSHVKECLGGQKSAYEDVKAEFSRHYDTNKQYRFMEALRNFVQHRGLPVHWIKNSLSWVEGKNSDLMETNFFFAASKEKLIEDSKFKKAAVRGMPEQIDLMFATRSYIACLSKVQTFVRDYLKGIVSESRKVFEKYRDQYAAVYDGSLVALAASEFEGKKEQSHVRLILDWDDIRKNLQDRNRELINLHLRYISSRSNEQGEQH